MSDNGIIKSSPLELVEVPCPRCGGRESFTVARGKDRLYGIPGEYFAAECRACGLWFQNPRPPLNRLSELYPCEYPAHLTPQAGVLRRGAAEYLRRHMGYTGLEPDPENGLHLGSLPVFSPVRKWLLGVNLTPHFIPGGKVLDIGCASGTFLLYLRRLGWEKLYGIELVPAAAAQAREAGLNVVSGQIEQGISSYQDGFFDVIISSMVFEHLVDPFAVVREVAKKLKPGGEFLFSLPLHDSLDAKLFGEFWGGFDFPRHLVHFSMADVRAMLREQFEDIESFHQSAPADFTRPASWRLAEGKGGLIDNIVLKLASSRAGYAIGFVLAKLGLTCRVSFRCRRKA